MSLAFIKSGARFYKTISMGSCMKIQKRVFLLVSFAVVFFFIASCGQKSSPTATNSGGARTIPLLSIVPSCSGNLSDWTATCLDDAYGKIQTAGFDITQQYIEWGRIETSRNTFDWTEFDDRLRLKDKFGLKNSVIVNFPDNAQTGVLPADITFTTFADPALKDRFSKFILALLERSNGKIAYLWIGNEIDEYLRNNRSQIVPFGEMYQDLCRTVAAKYPGVLIGTISTYHDALNDNALDIIETVGVHGNMIGFTFYPQIIAGTSPKDAPRLIGDISKIAARMGKKFAITESGWSTSTLGMNGSEQAQSEFIPNLLDGAAANAGSIEFLGLYVLYDLPDSYIQSIITRFGIADNKELSAMISSLGLFNNNGTPKSAWNILAEKIRQALAKQLSPA